MGVNTLSLLKHTQTRNFSINEEKKSTGFQQSESLNTYLPYEPLNMFRELYKGDKVPI